MVMEFLQPLRTDDAAGRRGHPRGRARRTFLRRAHTLERYTNAFYAPIVSDWRNNQQWTAAGKPEAMQRANSVWKQALAEYQQPHIDPAVRDELNAFVERRKSEGGAPTDF